MSDFTIYHNPRCGNSRGALALLQAEGEDPEVILYLENPPSRERLVELCTLLKMRPIEITRDMEAMSEGMSDDDVLDLLAKRPEFLQRPIVVKDNESAVIARPPAKVEILLN